MFRVECGPFKIVFRRNSTVFEHNAAAAAAAETFGKRTTLSWPDGFIIIIFLLSTSQLVDDARSA